MIKSWNSTLRRGWGRSTRGRDERWVISKMKSQISKTQIKNKKRVNRKPAMVPDNLEQLLSKITKDKLHPEFFTGLPVGKEII
jgi:hypothetical protein